MMYSIMFEITTKTEQMMEVRGSDLNSLDLYYYTEYREYK